MNEKRESDPHIKVRSISGLFTLIEVITSMTILVGIMLIAFMYLNSTQKVWTLSETSRDMGEDARIALDLMTKDLESIVYYDYDTEKKMPFLYWADGDSNTDTQLLLFVSQTPYKWKMEDESASDSAYFEVNYIVNFNSSGIAELKRRVFEYDSDYYDNGGELDIGNKITGDTDTDSSPEKYEEVIKNITAFNIKCFNISLNEIPKPDEDEILFPETGDISLSTITDSSRDPFAMEIELSLVPEPIAQKITQLRSAGKDTAADSVRDLNEKTYSRFIYIGNRVPQLNPGSGTQPLCL